MKFKKEKIKEIESLIENEQQKKNVMNMALIKRNNFVFRSFMKNFHPTSNPFNLKKPHNRNHFLKNPPKLNSHQNLDLIIC